MKVDKRKLRTLNLLIPISFNFASTIHGMFTSVVKCNHFSAQLQINQLNVPLNLDLTDYCICIENDHPDAYQLAAKSSCNYLGSKIYSTAWSE